MRETAADLLCVIRAFIDDVNGGDIASALGRLTDDVCIVEDLAPFRWTGPAAGGEWIAAMAANAGRLGATAIRMTPGEPQRVEVDGEHGYCIIPGRVTLRGPDVALVEDGLLTFVMRFEHGRWRVSAFTWTGDPPKPQ